MKLNLQDIPVNYRAWKKIPDYCAGTQSRFDNQFVDE
jgi:hypothetical protein